MTSPLNASLQHLKLKLNVESGLLRQSDVSETRQNGKQQWQRWINNVGSVDEAVSSAAAEFKGKHMRGTNNCTQSALSDLSSGLCALVPVARKTAQRQNPTASVVS